MRIVTIADSEVRRGLPPKGLAWLSHSAKAAKFSDNDQADIRQRVGKNDHLHEKREHTTTKEIVANVLRAESCAERQARWLTNKKVF